MNIDKAIELIKKHEGLRLTAYPDPGTNAEPWTIGYGHTGGVQQGDTISQDEANDFLKQDLAKFVDQLTLLRMKLNENQFNALLSFVYNTGIAQFKQSTMYKLIVSQAYQQAAEEFPKWKFANGRILPGLIKRRADEQALFLS